MKKIIKKLIEKYDESENFKLSVSAIFLALVFALTYVLYISTGE